MKQRIFIGSSVEGLNIAERIKDYFKEAIAPYVLKKEDIDMLLDILKDKTASPSMKA